MEGKRMEGGLEDVDDFYLDCLPLIIRKKVIDRFVRPEMTI